MTVGRGEQSFRVAIESRVPGNTHREGSYLSWATPPYACGAGQRVQHQYCCIVMKTVRYLLLLSFCPDSLFWSTCPSRAVYCIANCTAHVHVRISKSTDVTCLCMLTPLTCLCMMIDELMTHCS